MRLQGKFAVITGGGQGIGLAIARKLAMEGARVAVLDINESAANAALADHDKAHLGFACDVADSDVVDSVFAKVAEHFGRIDILVNNAGIGRAEGDGGDKARAGRLEREEQLARGEIPNAFGDQFIHMTDKGWQAVLDINLNGSFHCARAAVRDMALRGTKGAIINISSTGAVSGDGPVHYITSKAALLGMTRALAHELGPRGIRVNAVLPGFVETPTSLLMSEAARNSRAAKVPLGRWASGDEIAATVAFLASDEASYVSGEAMAVNGGYSFW
jgi:3-oxoacyl-[acyl-carrier protein] reductase